MRLIFDTTVLVDAEREANLGDLFSDEDDVAVAAISIAELMVGAELANVRQREGRTAFVKAVVDGFAIEPYDVDVALAHAALLANARRRGRPRGDQDLIVAATARARRRAVVTRDRRGFEDLPKVKLHPS